MDDTESTAASVEIPLDLLPQVLEVLPIGVWIMDRTGSITHGNPAGQRIWGGARYVGPANFGEYKGWWADTGRRIAADEWAAARAITKGETSLDEVIDIECFDDETDRWLSMEAYVEGHSTVQFSHGICPDCKTRLQRLWPSGKLRAM
jgi:PAS domain-containing protein